MQTLRTLTYETTGRIARITLNRPERGNGIIFDLPRELAACVERADLEFTGDCLNGAEAVAWGLASECAPAVSSMRGSRRCSPTSRSFRATSSS